VATTWCERNLDSVLDDIAAYSFWGEYQDSLAIDGIFVDETPTQYSPVFVSYLQSITQAVHGSDGLKEGFIGKVIISLRHHRQGEPDGSLHSARPCCDTACFLHSHGSKATVLLLAHCKPAIICVRG
jgi:hypothetical protein